MFIKLNIWRGGLMRIRVSVIECYYKKPDNDFTRVYRINDDEGYWLVRETPEEIDKLIEDSK